MSRQHFESCRQAFGPNPVYDFWIAHGRDYTIGPQTFSGPRGEAGMCYMNATHLAVLDPSLTYVEGKVSVYGVPIDHAWCVDADGVVVDPTLGPDEHGNMARIDAYFGVPLLTEYVRKASKMNGTYGVTDYFYARKTAPKLFELGLEAGQKWLLARPARRKHNRPTRRKEGV